MPPATRQCFRQLRLGELGSLIDIHYNPTVPATAS
jgi:hypothetical protein